ncbi:Na+/H+ antiporter subunit E [Corynebacterium sphenisci]|uniref:Na+/H+ antiporter subunit E n=1 Tax=Corynebacterium sphenisci TaxID=191493 RepID=UPI0026DFF342|nr:Na+/H+ antiporter subunit E [Corynebacterium sphenisci]MDO5731461.1 Na+/H+ antiporter subunit E [Corynebacterium sphenisci]
MSGLRWRDRRGAAGAPAARVRRARPSALMFAWLVAMWLLLWGEATAANLLSGVAVAAAVSLALPMPRVPVRAIDVHWPAMATLAATFAIDFTRASLSVAWLAVRRADPPPSAIVRTPMRTRDDLTLATAVALINLQPGGIVTDIDKCAGMLTMHILDGSSTGRIDATLGQLAAMERRVIRAFENRDPADGAADAAGAAGRIDHDHAANPEGRR